IERFQYDFPANKVQVINTPGIGRGSALNLAIENSHGAWIAIIDADDLWHPNKLAIQAGFLSNNVSVIATNHESFRDYPQKDIEINMKDTVPYRLYLKDFLVRNSICHSSVVIKKEDCVYDITRKSQFDLELWLRLSLQKKLILKIDQVLTY